jgi:Tfp pilus assembly protein PilX
MNAAQLSCPAYRPGRPDAQYGAASLVVILVLLACLSAVSFSVARVGLVEQRITNNDYRAREASAVAQAGLEYGVAWLTVNAPTWSVSGAVETSAPDTAMPTVTAGNGDVYSAAVEFSRDPANPAFVLVRSTASAASDPNISATVQVHARSLSLLNDPGLNTPPIMLDGCLNNVSGSPDVYPEGHDSGGTIGNAIVTSMPATVGGSDCIDSGSLDLHGGSIATEAFSGDLWDELFAVSRAEIKAAADAEVAAGLSDANRTVIWETSSGNYHKSWGSPEKPVILVFAPSANCPKMNGGPTIYGIVFMDSDCPAANGFGGLKVFGTVAVNGDIGKLNANPEFKHFGMSGGGSPSLGVIGTGVLPGSWKDF